MKMINQIMEALAASAHAQAAWTPEACWVSLFFEVIGYGRKDQD